MDSDSECFESADEEFDYIEPGRETTKSEQCVVERLKNTQIAEDLWEEEEESDEEKSILSKPTNSGTGGIKKESGRTETEVNNTRKHEKPVLKTPIDRVESNVEDVQIERKDTQHLNINKSEGWEEEVDDETLFEENIKQSVSDQTKRLTPEVKYQETPAEPVESTARKENLPTKVEKKERKAREPRSKLGTKLGTKIEKPKEKPPEQPVSNVEESGWDDWEPFESDKYQALSKKNTDDYYSDESRYKEIPQANKTTSNPTDVKKELKDETGWGAWGSWGVTSILNTATMSVSTLTNHVSQGISTVLESSIGAPDPEELARMHRENEERKRQQAEEERRAGGNTKDTRGFGLGNLVSGVSHITKLVETTGTKVLSGGLDTLEVIGKKTMEVLQEGDPGLKKKRALFLIDQDKPILSQILREAKEKAEQENKLLEEKHFAKKAHYETIFDDFHGLVHLEALEMLSRQCAIKLETIMASYSGNQLTETQETMAQVKELCEIPEDDESEDVKDLDAIAEKLNSAVTEINVKISYDKLIETWRETEKWLEDESRGCNERQLHQKAIETLAQLTAIAVEQFHKTGELLLVKTRRSTADEADSLVQLTTTLSALIDMAAARFSEKLNTTTPQSVDPDNLNSLITNVFLEAANSSSYIQNALQLLVPVLQVGAL